MFLENISLNDYSSYRIGGEAKYFFVAKTKKDLITAIKKAKQESLEFFILGGGSNILFSDKGFDGLIIKLELNDIEVRGDSIYAQAGVALRDLVNTALDNDLTGLEWATGIYGTIGGAIRGNAGAFNKYMSENVESVEYLDTNDLQIKEIKDYDSDYRNSYFKKNKNLIILSAIFRLKKGVDKKEMDRIMKYRQERHPLEYPSVGSVFKNIPINILDIKQFRDLGYVPAGYLIEQAGLKGKVIGGAQISEKHANFIVNINNAKAQDVLDLINLIKKTILEKYKIKMNEEIVIL